MRQQTFYQEADIECVSLVRKEQVAVREAPLCVSSRNADPRDAGINE